MHCALQCGRMRGQACVALPVVYNCVLLHGFQCLIIDTKLKSGDSQSSDSFANVLKQKVWTHYIFITYAGSTGYQELVDHA